MELEPQINSHNFVVYDIIITNDTKYKIHELEAQLSQHKSSRVFIWNNFVFDDEAGKQICELLKSYDYITELHIDKCDNFPHDFVFNEHIQLISISNIKSNIENVNLPISANKFYINRCIIDKLPKLPDSLTVLDICDCKGSVYPLESLPKNLQALTVWSTSLIDSFPIKVFPLTLSYIKLEDIHNLTELPELHEGLTCLELNNCPLLRKLPDKLPDTLTCLMLTQRARHNGKRASGLATLPSLPSQLKDLDCGYNPIGKLPELPPTLEYLKCNKCNLTELPELKHTQLWYLDCSKNAISKLPELPNTIYSLNCSNNRISMLPHTLPNAMTCLAVSNNKLRRLPKFDIADLQTFTCLNNPLDELYKLPEELPACRCFKLSLFKKTYKHHDWALVNSELLQQINNDYISGYARSVTRRIWPSFKKQMHKIMGLKLEGIKLG